MKKSETTKRKIYATALDLFQKKGYTTTTLRDIAKEAKISLGATYYYYPTKEAILIEYYLRVQDLVLDKVNQENFHSGSLASAVRKYFLIHLNTLDEGRNFMDIIVGELLSKESNFSPFQKTTSPIREKTLQTINIVLSIAAPKLKGKSLENISFLLWLLLLVVIFFWIHDQSKNWKNTKELTQEFSGLIEMMVSMERIPVFRSLNKKIFNITDLFFQLTKK